MSLRAFALTKLAARSQKPSIARGAALGGSVGAALGGLAGAGKAKLDHDLGQMFSGVFAHLFSGGKPVLMPKSPTPMAKIFKGIAKGAVPAAILGGALGAGIQALRRNHQKTAGWKLPLGIGTAGALAGAAASHVADKRDDEKKKWMAKRFYWLGRKGTRPGRPDKIKE